MNSVMIIEAERLMQEDFEWTLNHVSDMCEDVSVDLNRAVTDISYYDENTWEPLDPAMVRIGEQEEMNRFKKMNVYTYTERNHAMNDPDGKFVKVKWVRVKKGDKVRCRLVAQELGYGERMDELFAGTPSLGASRLAVAVAGLRKQMLMILDVKCAFLYGLIKRTVYIELPHQDPHSGDRMVVGKLVKSMYGTRDAPQVWQGEVSASTKEMGVQASILQPSV